MSPTTWRTGLPRRILSLSAMLAMGLVLAEVFLAVLSIGGTALEQPDPEIGWRLVSGASTVWKQEGRGLVEINSLGFRGPEPPVKGAKSFRVLVFGDSMTEARQVDYDQTFCFLLEQNLLREGIEAQVLNLGVSGYSPTQEWLLLRRRVEELEADLVIWDIFLDNDVSGVHPALTVSRGGPPFVSFENGKPHFDLSRPRNSYTSYHREPVHTLRKYSRLYRQGSRIRYQLGAKRDRRRDQTEGIPRRFQLYQDPLPEPWPSAWRTFDGIVVGLAREVDALGLPLLILNIPAGQVVNPDAWDRLLEKYPGMHEAQWNLVGPTERLRVLTREHDLLLVDAHGTFRRSLSEGPLHFGDLGHLTPRGHEVLAEFLTLAVLGSGLLPDR